MVDPSGICSLSWSPDETHLISCSLGHQATVYDIKDSCRKVQSIEGFEWPVGAAAWLPDGKSFVIGSHDPNRALDLYDLGSSRPVHTFIPPYLFDFSFFTVLLDCLGPVTHGLHSRLSLGGTLGMRLGFVTLVT